MERPNPNLSIEYIDGVTVAVPTDVKILEEEQIQSLEKTFMSLIEQNTGIRLLIDFSGYIGNQDMESRQETDIPDSF